MGVVGPCATKCQCTSGRSLLFAVRPWCDVPGTASTQPAFAWQTRGRHCIGYLLNLGAARALATRSRCATMVVVGLRSTEGHCTSERPPIWCKTVLRRACSGLDHTAGFCVTNARARRCAGYLLGGGVERALAPRASRAAMGVVGPCATKWQCTSGRSLPFAARSWCDVPGAASRTTSFCVVNERAPLYWLSLVLWRSTRACDARAVRRDGCGQSMRHGRPLHRREASYSVQDRAATCLL